MTILEYYLAKLNPGDVDVERRVQLTSGFTPADIQYFFQQVAAFEKKRPNQENYSVTAETFALLLPKVSPS